MSYTTPRTFVAGEVETASIFNTHLRDNVAWLATDKPMCHVYNSTFESTMASATWVDITHDSERFDNAAMHSTSSSTARITVPASSGGKYAFGGFFAWETINTGDNKIGRLLQNATNEIAKNSYMASSSFMGPVPSLNGFWSMAVADYVTMQGYQDATGTRTAYNPIEFWAYWIGN